MRFGRGTDEVDHLVVSVPRDVSPVDHHHLIAFVEFWIAPESKEEEVSTCGVNEVRT